MAVRDDLVVIQRNCLKAITLIELKDTVSTASIDPARDIEGELSVTLTPGQKLQLKAAYDAAIATIKTRAAGLP
jgi:hypothetical protein